MLAACNQNIGGCFFLQEVSPATLNTRTSRHNKECRPHFPKKIRKQNHHTTVVRKYRERLRNGLASRCAGWI